MTLRQRSRIRAVRARPLEALIGAEVVGYEEVGAEGAEGAVWAEAEETQLARLGSGMRKEHGNGRRGAEIRRGERGGRGRWLERDFLAKWCSKHGPSRPEKTAELRTC